MADEYSRDNESYGAMVEYSHDWNTSSFKIEVSFKEEPVLNPVPYALLEELYFRYSEFRPFNIICLEKHEVLAEKIRASYQRMRPQDIYDLYLFAREPYDRGLVKVLTIIKFWNTREPFDPYEFFTKIQQERFNFS